MSPTTGTQQTRLSRVVHHSALVLLLQVALLTCAVSNNFLVAHVVGPEGKGILYVLQLACNGLGLPALHFCFGFAAIYYLGQDRKYSAGEIASGMFLPSIALGLVPAVACFLLWPWARAWLMQGLRPIYFWIALLAIPLAITNFNVAQFSLGRHRVGRYNLLSMGPSALLTTFLFVLIAFHRTSVRSLVFIWFASIAIPGICAAGIAIVESKGRLLPRPEFLRKVFEFGWRSHLGGITQQLQHRAPILLVGYFLPIAQLGIYSLAVSLAELLWYIPNAISTVLMPHIASSTEEEARRGTPTFCRVAVGVTFVLAIVLSIVTAIVVPWLLPAFVSCLRPFYILMPGIVLATVFKVLASDFNGRGQPLKTFSPACAALVIELIAGVFFIPRGGLVAAAGITTAGYALNSLLYGWSYRRLTGIRLPELIIIKPQDLIRMRSAARGVWTSITTSASVAPQAKLGQATLD
ncbi:MAG: lipopolysaccharide biosynthesis protein [Terriglobales bacterium]